MFIFLNDSDPCMNAGITIVQNDKVLICVHLWTNYSFGLFFALFVAKISH